MILKERNQRIPLVSLFMFVNATVALGIPEEFLYEYKSKLAGSVAKIQNKTSSTINENTSERLHLVLQM